VGEKAVFSNVELKPAEPAAGAAFYALQQLEIITLLDGPGARFTWLQGGRGAQLECLTQEPDFNRNGHIEKMLSQAELRNH